ncbi:hypothetical protein [Methylocella silvestris]|uniref:Uncharacterized protein n=1 Tax=Methylocella silvestris TaxID=199596 RepID=A0A2J7THI3_METSI|nr:hypothetical protein [Methylocella silvestris]PNG26225.1 hypothetical protein CR492_08855 [Methylocella silvestris]
MHAKKPLPDIDTLPASALLNDAQVSALSGFAIITLKVWRREAQGQGPKVTRIEGWPRYRAGDVREWLSGKTQPK